MSFRSQISRILGAGLVLCLVSSVSRADVMTQTFHIPLTQTNWDPSTPSLSGADPFAVLKYSGPPAGLTSVTLTMDYEFDNTMTTRFANASTISVTTTGQVTISVPGVNGLTGTYARTETNTATDSDSFPKTVKDSSPDVKMGTQTATYSDSATLAKFEGSGTFSVPAIATANSGFTSSSGNGFGGALTQAKVDFTITYNFVPVPEPGSFVLMGLGGLGLLALNHRRSRSVLKKAESI